MDYAIGVDLGGTNIKAVAVEPGGRVLERRTSRTEAGPGGPEAWIDGVRELLDEVERGRGEPAAWTGLAAPGLAAPDGSGIVWMQGRLGWIQGLDWARALRRAGALPVVNDAHAALLGEAWNGAAKGARNVVMLTLGTGVGGGALVDGRLLQGHLGRGGHLGHICLDPDGPPDIVGTPGSLEDAVGECTLARRSDGRYETTESLVRDYRAGDAAAGGIWLASVKSLAAGLSSLINVLDPETVILGGGIVNAGDALFDPLNRYLDGHEWRPTGRKVGVVPAKLGEVAGAHGAACHAMMRAGALEL